jgi:hypothetical protein
VNVSSGSQSLRISDPQVHLRPLRSSDYEWLYAMLCRPYAGARWVAHGATPSHEEFRRLLWQGVFLQYVVETTSSMRPLGIVAAYNVSLRNGIAYMSAFARPRFTGSGNVIRGLALLVS